MWSETLGLLARTDRVGREVFRQLPLPHGAYQLAGQEHTDGCLILTLRRLA
jgi:hypothetical protein